MTAIPKCPTCGRRPSERIGIHALIIADGCTDPIHDLADQGPALKAECDEARALVMELFQRLCGEWEHHDQGTEVRWLYDHMASSTLREAQAALISWGMVKREECVRP